MNEEEFRMVVEEEWAQVPPPYRERIQNVALLIEDEPTEEIQKEEGMLLGLYQGIPLTERGEGYGQVLPDTITIYRLPTLKEAEESGEEVRKVVRDTIWHELGHYFGYDDWHLHQREDEGTNRFKGK